MVMPFVRPRYRQGRSILSLLSLFVAVFFLLYGSSSLGSSDDRTEMKYYVDQDDGRVHLVISDSTATTNTRTKDRNGTAGDQGVNENEHGTGINLEQLRKFNQGKPINKLLHRRNNIYLPHGPNDLTAIRLIGERHSGTSWITEVLVRCFPTVNVQNALLNQKHWLQHTPEHVVKMAQTYNSSSGLAPAKVRYGAQFSWQEISSSENPKGIFNKTFVVAIFRDPYDWMDAMRLLPHHWPNHFDYEDDADKDGRQKRLIAAKSRRHSIYSSIHDKGPQDLTPKESFKQRVVDRSKKWAGRFRPKRTNFDSHRRLLEEDAGDPYFQKGRRHLGAMANTTDRKGIPWQDFVKRNMTIGKARPESGERLCQKGYDYSGVSPCIATPIYIPDGMDPKEVRTHSGSLSDPVYELRLDGTPYSHPLELRAIKLNNFLDLPTKWEFGGFLPVKYEDLKAQGTQFLLDAIAKAFGVPADCDPTPPNPEKGNHDLETDWQEWITQHADWEMEARVGYEPR
jgi:hypothetical protein